MHTQHKMHALLRMKREKTKFKTKKGVERTKVIWSDRFKIIFRCKRKHQTMKKKQLTKAKYSTIMKRKKFVFKRFYENEIDINIAKEWIRVVPKDGKKIDVAQGKNCFEVTKRKDKKMFWRNKKKWCFEIGKQKKLFPTFETEQFNWLEQFDRTSLLLSCSYPECTNVYSQFMIVQVKMV